MEQVHLPTEKAQEPNEEARQPKFDTQLQKSKSKKNNITFAEDADETENTPSQAKSACKDYLSQPAPELSHHQKMLWLQKRRTQGLWVQCDDCDRWRYLDYVIDSHELPKKWYCRMNADTAIASCSAVEAPIPLRDEEDLIHSEYSAGSVVWARLAGWPWWPAMVDDCPDTEQFYWLDGFSDIPTYYNVVFFDAHEVTRGWILPNLLKPYRFNKKNFNYLVKDKKYKKRLEVAMRQADDADMLPLTDRLSKYSFISRYNGTINHPKKIKKHALRKYRNQLKRKLNIDFFSESSSDSDSEYSETQEEKKKPKRKNDNLSRNSKKANKTASKITDVNLVIEQTAAENEVVKDNLANTLNNKSRNDVIPPDSMAVQIGSSQFALESNADGN
ncbi:uncharacterized protein ACR2FA_002854 [Aphomia sociella]